MLGCLKSNWYFGDRFVKPLIVYYKGTNKLLLLLLLLLYFALTWQPSYNNTTYLVFSSYGQNQQMLWLSYAAQAFCHDRPRGTPTTTTITTILYLYIDLYVFYVFHFLLFFSLCTDLFCHFLSARSLDNTLSLL